MPVKNNGESQIILVESQRRGANSKHLNLQFVVLKDEDATQLTFKAIDILWNCMSLLCLCLDV